MASYDIVAGTSSPLGFQLFESGVPINLAGLTVTAIVADKTGTLVSAGVVTVTDAANGKVLLTPTNTAVFDQTKSPYAVRWKLVDGTGAVGYVPTGQRDLWNIIST